jgi:uncharacterized membrane protein (UPF0127 family)
MLMNARTGEVVASAVELADTRATRRRGLLGRDSLDASTAMVISPCFSIHTISMRFAIDVVFIDREGVVVRILRDLGPWRLAIAPRARAVVEMAAGGLSARDVRVGDRLYLAAEPAPAGRAVSWPIPA